MKYFLIVLMVFLGLGASAGGLLMILDPSGHLLGMPLSVIEPSPFRDFLIPGLILFLVLGVMSLLVSIGLLRDLNLNWQSNLIALMICNGHGLMLFIWLLLS